MPGHHLHAAARRIRFGLARQAVDHRILQTLAARGFEHFLKICAIAARLQLPHRHGAARMQLVRPVEIQIVEQNPVQTNLYARGACLPAQTAPQVAARVDRHYNALHSLEVHFVQTYTGMGMNRKEAGVLLLKKPGKMRLTYTDPDGKLFVLDGKDGYKLEPAKKSP